MLNIEERVTFDTNEKTVLTKEDIDRLLEEIGVAETQDKAKALMHELQTEFWNDLPVINIGLFNNTDAYSEKVTGFKNFIGPVFWNVSVEE